MVNSSNPQATVQAAYVIQKAIDRLSKEVKPTGADIPSSAIPGAGTVDAALGNLDGRVTTNTDGISGLNTNLGSLSDLVGQFFTGMDIPAYSDLQNLTNIGMYISGTSTEVADYTNCPTTAAFTMLVLPGYGSTRRVQVVFPYSGDAIFTRKLTSISAATDWQRLNMNDIGSYTVIPFTLPAKSGGVNGKAALTFSGSFRGRVLLASTADARNGQYIVGTSGNGTAAFSAVYQGTNISASASGTVLTIENSSSSTASGYIEAFSGAGNVTVS